MKGKLAYARELWRGLESRIGDWVGREFRPLATLGVPVGESGDPSTGSGRTDGGVVWGQLETLVAWQHILIVVLTPVYNVITFGDE